MHLVRHFGLLIVLAALTAEFALAQQQKGPATPNTPGTREFTEQDALNTLRRIGDALESHNEQHFLREFDPARFPDYAVFRDQVHAFFVEYESFSVSYRLQQVAMDNANGVALADFTLEARYAGGEQPDFRKEVQLRLVTDWDGKGWKIIEWSPREIFGKS